MRVAVVLPVVGLLVLLSSAIPHAFRVFVPPSDIAGLTVLDPDVVDPNAIGSLQPLHWVKADMAFRLNISGSRDLALGLVSSAVESSVASWNMAGGELHLESGLTTEATLDLHDNQNTLFWDYSGSIVGSSFFARTFLRYDTRTGEIIETDIGFNGKSVGKTTCDGTTAKGDLVWTIDQQGVTLVNGVSRRVADVQNVLTHELGHAVGIGHSKVAHATMSIPNVTPTLLCSTELRTLESDDVEAVRFTYPPSHPSADLRITSNGLDATTGGQLDVEAGFGDFVSVSIVGSTNKPDVLIATWKWLIDGQEVSTANKSFTVVLGVGVHTVTLTAINTANMASTSVSAKVNVVSHVSNRPPSGAFAMSVPSQIAVSPGTLNVTADPTTNEARVTFSDQSTDPDGTADIVSRVWTVNTQTEPLSIGDLTFGWGFTPGGPYIITLTVTDRGGLTSTTSGSVIVNAATEGAGPQSVLYLTASNRVFVVRNGLALRSWQLHALGEAPIAVSTTIRTLGDFSGLFGSEYSLLGSFTGTTYTYPLGTGTNLYDGTTDGLRNYSIDYSSATVYRFDSNWSNPVAVFQLFDTIGGQSFPAQFRYVGITYDSSTGSIWLSRDKSDLSGGTIENRTLTGGFITSFDVPLTGLGGLALDPADHTLWFGAQSLPGTLLQYSRAGSPMGSLFLQELVGAGQVLGGEFQLVRGEPPPTCPLVTGSIVELVDCEITGDPGIPLAATTVNFGNVGLEGIVKAQVFRNAAGTIDLYYQVTNTSSNHPIERVVHDGFTAFATDVFFRKDAVGIFSAGSKRPRTADRDTTGDVVGFTFRDGTESLGPGETSVVFVIRTNAANAGSGHIFVIDGGVVGVTTFGPLP